MRRDLALRVLCRAAKQYLGRIPPPPPKNPAEIARALREFEKGPSDARMVYLLTLDALLRFPGAHGLADQPGTVKVLRCLRRFVKAHA